MSIEMDIRDLSESIGPIRRRRVGEWGIGRDELPRRRLCVVGSSSLPNRTEAGANVLVAGTAVFRSQDPAKANAELRGGAVERDGEQII